MALKPQDVYVLLKLAATGGERRVPYSQLALDLGMSPSEVHASVKRSQASGLLHGSALGNRLNVSALEEFLFHGLRYSFPAERGGLTRGVPTSWGAEPVRSQISSGADPVPVWPYEGGAVRGVALTPLYKSAPAAALRHQSFYEYLVLADALRDGRARERSIARTELHDRLKPVHAEFKL